MDIGSSLQRILLLEVNDLYYFLIKMATYKAISVNSDYTTENADATKFNITTENAQNIAESINIMKVLQIIIASLGITTNLIVAVAFLNHKKLRAKIPNICIINQVR